MTDPSPEPMSETVGHQHAFAVGPESTYCECGISVFAALAAAIARAEEAEAEVTVLRAKVAVDEDLRQSLATARKGLAKIAADETTSGTFSTLYGGGWQKAMEHMRKQAADTLASLDRKTG